MTIEDLKQATEGLTVKLSNQRLQNDYLGIIDTSLAALQFAIQAVSIISDEKRKYQLKEKEFMLNNDLTNSQAKSCAKAEECFTNYENAELLFKCLIEISVMGKKLANITNTNFNSH